MKFLLSVLFIAFACQMNAQISFNTGDADLDADLNVINTSAKTDLTAFKTDLMNTFGVTSKNIDYMVSINMEPGEMFLALEISVAVNKPIEEVIDVYEQNRDKGWGYIAQQMGIKPGSPEFHALKEKSKTKKDNTSKTNNGGNSDNNNGKGNTSKKKK